jgi:hypothetical protein
MLLMFAISLVSQAAAIANVTPYSRMGAEILIAGDNLSTATGVRFLAARDSRIAGANITADNAAEVVHDAMDAGPSIDWTSQGSNLPITLVPGNTSQLLRFTVSSEGGSLPRVMPIRVNATAGNSATYVLHKPEIWAVLGAPAAKLVAGRTYSLIGRNMASVTRIFDGAQLETSAWLRRSVVVSTASNPNGTACVVTTSGAHGLATGDKVRLYGVTGHALSTINQTHTITVATSTTFSLQGINGNNGATGTGGQASILFRCIVTPQRGGTNTFQFGTSAGHCFDFKLPAALPAGTYSLVASTNDSAWGVSNPITVTTTAGIEQLEGESWQVPGGDPRGVIELPLNLASDIVSVSNPNGAEYVVTTSSAHGLRDGQLVHISGVSGHAGASPNGQWQVAIASSTTFTLSESGGTGGAAGTGGKARYVPQTGDDVSHMLQRAIFAATTFATSSMPVRIVLPAGSFFLSHVIVLPANVGLAGAGMDQTTLSPHPSLAGSTTTTWAAGTFSSNLDAYDDQSGNFSGYGSATNSGFFSGTQTVYGRPCVLKIGGDNCRLENLTIEASADPWRQTATDTIGADNGIDEIVLNHVRVRNELARTRDDSGTSIYPAGILLVQNHVDWVLRDCHFDANRAYVGTINSRGNQSSNGLCQRFLIEGCRFTAPTPTNSGSTAGFLGTNWLVINNQFDGLNRCITGGSGDYAYRSVVAYNTFANTGTDFGGSECVLYEHREGRYLSVSSATSTTVVVASDFSFPGHVVAIVQGKGMGQYRRVSASSYSAPNNTLTVDTPWLITPDSTSRVLIDGTATDLTFTANAWHNTKGGINFFGGSLGIIIEANSFNGSREGIMIDLVNSAVTTPDAAGHSAWTTIDRNQFAYANALRLQAVRSATFAATNTWPMIFAVNYRGNEITRDCTSAIATGIGETTIGSTASNALLDASPLVLCVHAKSNDYVTDPGRYQFAPVWARRIPDAPLLTCGRGCRDVVFAANSIDNVPLTSDQARRVNRSFDSRLPPLLTTLFDLARENIGF